jgi:hypothetical protein
MRRTEVLQEIRKKRFKEANGGWNGGRLSQAEAANRLGKSERNFRRYLSRYEEAGEAGLEDRRLESCVARGAPVDEVLTVQRSTESIQAGTHSTFMPGIKRPAAHAATAG